ncbi:hypothetical protein JTE90_009600 [Oedothorax gibbosus]|uniref:NFX1-type zinc finger-containing protein 1 n=1 Tax=Oedothorax gibbosus TaxID=931172 RepID=A0AAV6VK05_9ARAC|nr:hypothetical protein JTE90_009600 [Oedothorax gibbosus]
MSEKIQHSYRRLTKQDLFGLSNKNGSELKDILCRPGFGFEKYIEKQDYISKDKVDFEVFYIIAETAARVCASRLSNETGSIMKFLKLITGCEEFLFTHCIRVIDECLVRNRGINHVLFIKNYIIIIKTIVKYKLPCTQTITDVTYPILQNVMNKMINKRPKNLEETQKEFDFLKKLVERRSVSFLSEEDDDQVELFRQLSIMPKDNDVINCEVPDLPCNKIDGPYNSVNHYLSVHFRLMREDMLRMFRDCISEHNNPSEKRRSGSRKYEQVNVCLPPSYKYDGIAYKISIRTNEPVNYAKKEVLMPGNIVCLTNDNYKTVYFAVITKQAKSVKGNNKEGESEIRMDDTFDEVLTADVNYLMFETTAYFECYRHVLSALKEFNKNTLPLSDFLVYLYFEIPEPEYLLDQFEGKKYCLHEKCDGFEVAQREGDPGPCDCTKFNPLNYNEWPSPEELKLDVQQVEAFQTALTRKVAVIQGPPGTGKTYLGVKVVKAFLQNLSLTPIIICCLTNHALDQFLEHIFKFTKNVVRLGSQSKSNILEPHTLENLMMAYNSHAQNSNNPLLNTDKILKESIKHLKSFAPMVLATRAAGDWDRDLGDLRYVCDEINSLNIVYYKCKDEYLQESALNAIIGFNDKDQLRKGSKTVDSQNVCYSVLEWLCRKSTNELYAECEKRFHKLEALEIVKEVPNFKLWSLDLNKRFELFYVWRKKCLSVLCKNIEDKREEYKNLRNSYKGRSPDPVRVEILQKAHVIGVTTTGAAKYRKLLRYCGPKILIVEEAAEVLESHIISSLLPSTQHLILIGDHKQLRPLPANNELSELYNLKISMFERLFNNGAPSATLVSQHRMKPCIANLLIQDELYPDLKSFENVQSYEDIKGVKSSMFFLNHNKKEDDISTGTSCSNNFEANMIVYLAKYLITLSYTEEQITIIATYAAQVALIQKFLDIENLSIKNTTVDNYQGEENDIVLISFVRNNKSGLIGFLKENNRVCVALSRAKKGMFCLGNFSSYAAKSPLWANILAKSESTEAIGPKLPLICSKHGKETLVETPEEIQELIRRGCDNPCGFELQCGHFCERKCHYNDPEHTRYPCTQPCEKYVTETKKCTRMCYRRCKKSKKAPVELPCGHIARYKKDDTIITKCEEEIQRLLPCDHMVTLPCCDDIAQHKCKAIMPVVLSCGHKKLVFCYKSHDLSHVICTDSTPRMSSCGHTVYVKCCFNFDPSELLTFCTNSCGQLLTCGHPCTGNCSRCSDVGIHAMCTEKCEVVLNCGHVCSGFCGNPCLPCDKKCLMSCSHNKKCINSCYRPCARCENKCERKCEHGTCSNQCSEKCSIKACTFPCSKILPCGHKCIGLCGEGHDPCPYLCRVCNESDLTTGNPKTDYYVQLDDCDHVIENKSLKEHIEMCLECFLWPDCPECKKPITKSIRYKEFLLEAKDKVIKLSASTKEIEEVYYHLNSITNSDMIVPAEFVEVFQDIANILSNKKQNSGSLLVLKNCITYLGDLMRINKQIKTLNTSEKSELLQRRFETLLLWICNHLDFASFQQFEEIEKAIKELEKNVKDFYLA